MSAKVLQKILCKTPDIYLFCQLQPSLTIHKRIILKSICSCSSVTSFPNKMSQSILNLQLPNVVALDSFSRKFCTNKEPPRSRFPTLMPFPKIVWPSLVKSMKNFILTTFIIRPYLDREFNIQEFVLGSKRAVEVVSKKVSEGELKSLDGLVTEDVIPTLQRSVSAMSLSEREQIAINTDDIYFSFPYQVQIGIIFNDEETEQEQKRFVEITMVYHALRGLGSMRLRGEEPPLNMGLLPEYQSKISVCNYRFVREFTKGVESDWTVNLLNHFRPDDVD